MNYHGTDISTRSSQFRPSASQPGQTRADQNPNSAPSNHAQAAAFPSQPRASSRPQTIAELAKRAKQSLGDDVRPLKAWLRIAENARRSAKNFDEQGDLDSAFVHYAKAATIVLEKIPGHPDYRVLLSTTQRHNMGLHGEDILASLAGLKVKITIRYETWGAYDAAYLRSQAPPFNPTHTHNTNSKRPPLRMSNRIPIQPIISVSSHPPDQHSSLMNQHQIVQGYDSSRIPSIALYTGELPRGFVPCDVLKTVSFPLNCLNRFISIALINTARNRETCGLLLGTEEGGRYVVTTLLIPEQHATRDTCTIDDEELVMQFTEMRSLITLGWIHTHPKQSCFMSSVDLHTHSGFQRVLPESFAVVCAPNSIPNFGIFRLTSLGLETILECQVSEAFHPHPDRSIYTDVDKGHVKIGADLPLEIVDLRGQTTLESINGDGSIASSSRLRALAPPPKDTVEVSKGFSSRYRYPEAAGLREEKKEEAADAARTVAGNDEPQAISELETPKQNHTALPSSNPPSQRSAEPALLTGADLQPAVGQHDQNLAPRNATSTTQAVANPRVEVSEGFDMLDNEPERHSEQADYLRILRDKFGTPRPNGGNRYSFIDDTSLNNGGSGNILEKFFDPDNESYDGRHSLKSVSKRSVLTSSIASPASSQVTSIFN